MRAPRGIDKFGPEREAMFWGLVNKTENCWIWEGKRTGRGYGRFAQMGAHRYSWMLSNNVFQLSSKDFVCHHCDNPPCVRPEHLFLGDAKANNRDCHTKKRYHAQNQTHCKRGHEFTEENTRLIPQPRTDFSREQSKDELGVRRVCKACRETEYSRPSQQIARKNKTTNRAIPSWATPKGHRLVTINGETMSLTAWARVRGIRKEAFFSRLNRGIPVEDALNMPMDTTTRRRIYSWMGQEKSLSAWSKELGVSKSILRDRLLSGWTTEEAFTKPVDHRPTTGLMLSFDGQTMNTSQWARKIGISSQSLCARLKRGWTVEEALTMAADPQHRVVSRAKQ